MSYLLELLGRGLQNELGDMLDRYFWSPSTKSLNELEVCCREHPDWPDIQCQLGLAHLRAMRIDEAIEHLWQACRQNPDYLAGRVALAAAYEESGQPQRAMEHLKIANQIRPGEAPILFAIGFCCEKTQRPEDAAEYYRDSVARDGRFIPARQRLAVVSVVLDQIEEAIEQYEIMRHEEPQEIWVHSALAHLYYRCGKYQKAIEQFETAISMEPENWALMDDAVEALVAGGQVREAIDRLHALAKQQGPFADIYLRLGDLYAQVNDDSAAQKYYEAALEIHPGYLEATAKFGHHHLDCGRWDQAAEAFHQAAEINDKTMTNYVGLGVAQLAAGKKAEAMNSFDLASAVEPNSILLMAEMARLQLKTAVAGEFLKSFRGGQDMPIAEIDLDNDDLLHKQIDRHGEQVMQHGNHADIRYHYGVLLRADNRTGEAMEQFAKAVEINPTYVQAMIKLGICQQEVGMADEAVETFKSALELEPGYVDLHYRLGLLYTEQHLFDQAVSHMETAAGGAPHNEQIRASLALALQNMGLMDRAAATWRSFWKMHQAKA